jgi:hypothetical protein
MEATVENVREMIKERLEIADDVMARYRFVGFQPVILGSEETKIRAGPGDEKGRADRKRASDKEGEIARGATPGERKEREGGEGVVR